MICGYWTRQEVIKLADFTRGAFQVFENLDIVKPQKLAVSRNGIVLYEWEQLLAAKIYSKLREQMSLQSMKNILEQLDLGSPRSTAKGEILVIYLNQIYWVDTDKEAWETMKKSDNTRGRFIMTFSMANLIKEIEASGKKHKVMDIEKRLELALHDRGVA